MKGRNTTVISIRLDDTIMEILKERAGNKSISEYLKAQILKGCSVNNNVVTSVNTMLRPNDKTLDPNAEIIRKRIKELER